MPGQPMYYAIPAKAAQPELARKFVELATSPEVQADGIVKQFNWYPGIDAQYVQGEARREDLEQALRRHHAAGPLEAKAQPFPLSPYFTDVLERL